MRIIKIKNIPFI